MITETDAPTGDGRTLRVYHQPEPAGLTVLWQHGTPQAGPPPAPLVAASAEQGVRWVSYDRPGYGGSPSAPGRTVADAAADLAAVADHLEVERFAVMGVSGGGPHVLAGAALLPGRVTGAVSVAGLAPFGADGLDWFAGMWPGGVAEFRAATDGAAAVREHVLGLSGVDPAMFARADWAALEGPYGEWLIGSAKLGGPGVDGFVDDDLALVGPWGFDPASITVPVLVVHGEADRMVPPGHGAWLARRCPSATLWSRPGAGHLSILAECGAATDWLRAAGS
jgi:pimeloyl-ACP methyl ester carboxylesterase